MAKRGRKPIDIGYLTFWEHQWYQAFHHLREGRKMPSHASWWRLSDLKKGDLRSRLTEIREMSVAQYWADFLRRRPLLPKLPLAANLEQAKQLQADEIHSLSGWIEPKRIRARSGRAEIWRRLWQARSLSALEDACSQWKSLGEKAGRALAAGTELDVDQSDYTMANFPTLLLENAKDFLAMKRNVRFPAKHDGADDSRLDYLARGMAGIMIGVSPITAIERLRNFEHGSGGPLWIEKWQLCDCWRCELQREKDAGDALLASLRTGESE